MELTGWSAEMRRVAFPFAHIDQPERHPDYGIGLANQGDCGTKDGINDVVRIAK